MDDRERKVLLSDDHGSLRVINAVNGNVMKALDPHACAIQWLSYVFYSRRVVSIAMVVFMMRTIPQGTMLRMEEGHLNLSCSSRYALYPRLLVADPHGKQI